MSILVDQETRLVVQGITGREGSFHALRNKAYGTAVVAGVTPGKAGETSRARRSSTPSADAVAGTAANASVIYVPAPFAADATSKPSTPASGYRLHHRGHSRPRHASRLRPPAGATSSS